MTGVLLIRHGESEANKQNTLVSYRGDPGLTEQGRREAKDVAKAWQRHPLVALYASPLRRTLETASAFVRPDLPVQVDSRLHEIALGVWDGMTIPDIERTDADRYHNWKQDPESGAPDGGEPLSAVGKRMHEFLNDMRNRHPTGLVVAVTHSDCLKATVLATLESPWKAAQWFHVTNTAGIYLEWRDGHWQMMAYPIIPAIL